MKKFIISLNLIILALFFTMNLAYCEEDFFSNANFVKAQSTENSAKDTFKNIQNTVKEKTGFFSNLFKNKKNNKEEKGYYGSLPNINKEFQYKRRNENLVKPTDTVVPSVEDLDKENLQKAPFDDALFLDVIIKQEKKSEYVNDIQKVKFSFTSLKKCIEEDGNIQRFNANVNMIDLYAKNLKKKYENKPESSKESYIAILNSNYYSKLLGNLLYDSNYYARYIPTKDGKYSEQNIKLEKEKLLNRINKTLFLINNEI